MLPASMGQLATLAKFTDEAWDNLLHILNGQYEVPGAISHFNMMGRIPHTVVDIIDGKLALKSPETCTRWKATPPPAAVHLGGGEGGQAG